MLPLDLPCTVTVPLYITKQNQALQLFREYFYAPDAQLFLFLFLDVGGDSCQSTSGPLGGILYPTLYRTGLYQESTGPHMNQGVRFDFTSCGTLLGSRRTKLVMQHVRRTRLVTVMNINSFAAFACDIACNWCHPDSPLHQSYRQHFSNLLFPWFLVLPF